MAFAIIALVYFIPISIAIVESLFGVALVSHFIKRGLMFSLALRREAKVSVHRLFPQCVMLFLKSFKPVDSPLSLPLAAFVFSGFLSIFFSHYLVLSLRGFFFKLLEWVYLYFLFIEAISDRKRMKIVMWVFFVSALLAGVDGLVQHLTGKEFIFGRADFDGRISASFRHPNDFGAYLVVVSSLAFSFLWLFPGGSRNPWGSLAMIRKQDALLVQGLRVFVMGLFLLLYYDLGWTFSRGAWGAFLLAFIYLGSLRKWRVVIPLLLIVVFMQFFSPQMEEKRKVSFITDDTGYVPRRLKMLQESSRGENGTSAGGGATADHSDGRNGDYLRAILEPLEHFSGSGRSAFWEDAIPIIRHSPIFGNGINTYSQMAKGRSGYPHNCYLQLTAEMGLLGLAIFGWMLYVLFREARRGLAWVKDSVLAFVLPGAMAGLMGFLVHSFVDTNFYSVQLGNLMWVTMGMIGACLSIQKRLDGMEGPGRPFRAAISGEDKSG